MELLEGMKTGSSSSRAGKVTGTIIEDLLCLITSTILQEEETRLLGVRSTRNIGLESSVVRMVTARW